MSEAIFHHVGRTVSDMEAALRFYRDIVGLRVVDDAVLEGEEMSEFIAVDGVRIRAVMLSQDDRHPFLELFEFHEPPPPSGVAPRPNDLGSTHPCFLTDDIDATHERLVKAGVRVTRPPLAIEEGPFAGQSILYAYDPDGAVVEFWSTPPT